MVLIHTGHGFWWMKDNKKYADGEPGIGMAAAKWLTEKKVSLVGADNWAVEVVPAGGPRPAVPGPPVADRPARRLHPGEPRPERAGEGQGVPVRVRVLAAAAEGGDRLARAIRSRFGNPIDHEGTQITDISRNSDVRPS